MSNVKLDKTKPNVLSGAREDIKVVRDIIADRLQPSYVKDDQAFLGYIAEQGGKKSFVPCSAAVYAKATGIFDDNRSGTMRLREMYQIGFNAEGTCVRLSFLSVRPKRKMRVTEEGAPPEGEYKLRLDRNCAGSLDVTASPNGTTRQEFSNLLALLYNQKKDIRAGLKLSDRYTVHEVTDPDFVVRDTTKFGAAKRRSRF